MAGEIILTIAYGLQIQEHDDPYVAISQEAVESLNAAVVPGAFFVDFLPVLKHVPEWVPGAGFKRKARAWRALALATVNTPFEGAVRAIDSGDFTPSFVSYSWENLDASGDLEEEKEVIKGTAAAMYSAGLDTMVSIGASCILGFLSNPEALRKARQEIDRVVGTERLPNFGDRDSLPYIIAVTKEALRWKDVGPLAIPHFIDVEDEYKGYRIPAGSIVLPNAWAILHNEAAYPDPFTFNPDRFMKDGKLNEDIKDPASAAFGFGRRICPGRYMGFSAVWITIASLVAAFDIGKAVDADGNVIEPSYEYTTTGLIQWVEFLYPLSMSLIEVRPVSSAPLPFECSIKPRSPQAEILIRETLDAEYF
ncbi:hypothetical protein H0H81_010675 [Sphagnurus paluster]|uniref:Cytochrome P450 n=1 Tax=Sphagnurus paluster TaxID=117069 RepID=A0A9P7GP61_9AGAR|nr:hypothetical protein H0H81_010675 [Sphagnurus paluster]